MATYCYRVLCAITKAERNLHTDEVAMLAGIGFDNALQACRRLAVNRKITNVASAKAGRGNKALWEIVPGATIEPETRGHNPLRSRRERRAARAANPPPPKPKPRPKRDGDLPIRVPPCLLEQVWRRSA